MFKLQNMKGKLASSMLGATLAVSLAVVGFVVPAFADSTDTDVFLISENKTDPGEGVDYDLNVPTGGVMGKVDPATGNITYNTISGTQPYSVELENLTVLPLKISSVEVTDKASFNYVTSTALSTTTAADALATTITPSDGGTPIEIADAKAAAVTPTGWNNVSGNGTQGYVFGNAGVKNLSIALSETVGLLAYTVTWTVDWA